MGTMQERLGRGSGRNKRGRKREGGLAFSFRGNQSALKKAVALGMFKSLTHAAAVIRLTAKRSVRGRSRNRPDGTKARRVNYSASPPGQPVRSPTGLLRHSLRFVVDKEAGTAVIGTDASFIDQIGNVHEFGGTFRGANYPARPFIGPAFRKHLPQLSKFWGNSVKAA